MAVVVGLTEKKDGVKVSSSIAVPTFFHPSDESCVSEKKSCGSSEKSYLKICVCRRKLVTLHQISKGNVLIRFVRWLYLLASGKCRLSEECV